MLQSRLGTLLVNHAYIAKLHAGDCPAVRAACQGRSLHSGMACAAFLPSGRLRGAAVKAALLHACLLVEDGVNPGKAGQGAGDIHNQVRQLDKLHQNLGHIVHQGHHLALGQDAAVHLAPSRPDQKDDSRVDNGIGQRI